MFQALLREIELQKSYLGNEPIESIYFGGGTPSLSTTDEIEMLIGAIKLHFNFATNIEITLEANPDDITYTSLGDWGKAGINRLSIGVQSFFDEDLKWMNRAHTAKQAIDSLQSAIQFFPNITIDLIYGIPHMNEEKWKYNVDKAVSLKIPHLSCYALTVEPKTLLHKMIRQHKTPDTNAEQQSIQFLRLMDWLDPAGYEHYEISNFAKPGNRSRHNSAYWQGKKYIGIGPSAHSYNGSSRQWNISNNQLYIESIKKNLVPYEKEILTTIQQLNEYIMTSLRTMEGVNSVILNSRYQISSDEFNEKSKKFIQNKLMLKKENSFLLTNEGKLLADGIAADLFYK